MSDVLLPDQTPVRAPACDVPFDPDANDETLPVLAGLRQRFGDVVRIPPAARESDSFFISAPDDIRRVLLTNRHNYTKGVGLERVKLLLGNGLIVSEGDFWARQRRMIQPAFHGRVIRGFSDLIRRENLALAARWARHAASREPVNVTRETSDLALHVVLGALFSIDLERLIEEAGGNPFDLIARDSQRDLAFAVRFRQLVRPVLAMIEARRREGRVEMDFLSMLMEARDKDTGEPMSARALLDEVMSLIVAGHETTATTLNWTWYLLSQHGEIERRLHAAVDAAGPPGDLTIERALGIEYPLMVVRETMRLYPPVWLFGRRAVAADRLGGFDIPAGADLFVCPWLLHRDPRHWSDAGCYDPSRFTARAEEERHRFAYLPFSAGPRHCVGEGFAMAEMAMHLVMTARRFRLKYCGSAPPEAEFQINLRTRHDVTMQVVDRQPPERTPQT